MGTKFCQVRAGRITYPMTLITDTDSLARFCRAARDHPYVTVDTEFMRERTYYSILCLVQLAARTSTKLHHLLGVSRHALSALARLSRS